VRVPSVLDLAQCIAAVVVRGLLWPALAARVETMTVASAETRSAKPAAAAMKPGVTELLPRAAAASARRKQVGQPPEAPVIMIGSAAVAMQEQA